MRHYAPPAPDRPAQIVPPVPLSPDAARNEAADRCLEHRLLNLGRAMDREMVRRLKAMLGLTVAEWRVLTFVCATGAASAVDICAARDTDPAEVSRAVASLLTAGLVRREVDDGQRRRKIITPTDAGRAMAARAAAMREDFFATLMQDVPSAGEQALGDMLENIALRANEWHGLPRDAAGREAGALPDGSGFAGGRHVRDATDAGRFFSVL